MRLSKSVVAATLCLGADVVRDLSHHRKLVLDNNVGGYELAYSGLGLADCRFAMFGLETTAGAGYKALYRPCQNVSGRDEFRWNGPTIGSTIRFFRAAPARDGGWMPGSLE